MRGHHAIREDRKHILLERTATVLHLYRAVGAALMEPPHKIQIWRIDDPEIEPNGTMHLGNKKQTIGEAQLLEHPNVWVQGSSEFNRRMIVETTALEGDLNEYLV
jgi:hypothetical protein